jgi:predicted nucleotidyltransferase
VKVVSLPGLAVLKLFSWKERRFESNKDASDLAIILHSYWEAWNTDRISEGLPDVLEQEDFDFVAAGARLLGKDAALFYISIFLYEAVFSHNRIICKRTCI